MVIIGDARPKKSINHGVGSEGLKVRLEFWYNYQVKRRVR